MGEFITAFLEALERRHDELLEVLGPGEGKAGPAVGSWFAEHWVPGQIDETLPGLVLSVDASFRPKEYAGGVSVIYARALAMKFEPKGEPKVVGRKFDVVPHPGPTSEVRDLLSRIGEHLEHLLCLEYVRESEEPGLLLLDGSIVAREMAAAFNFRWHRSFSMDYALALSQLLEEVREKRWRLASVSKSSRASPVRELALSEIFKALLAELSQLSLREVMTIEAAWEAASTNPDQGVKLAGSLAEKYPQHSEALDRLAALIYERYVRRSDVKVIEKHVKGPGRTQAVAIGPYTHAVQAMLNALEKSQENLLNQALSGERARRRLLGEELEELERRAKRAMREVLRMPVCAVTYARFRSDDEPMRIDLPGWEAGVEEAWSESPPESLVDPEPESIGELVSHLASGYAGPNFHNVWLEKVDREVKMREETLNRVYEPILWKRLRALIPHARGERRVRRI